MSHSRINLGVGLVILAVGCVLLGTAVFQFWNSPYTNPPPEMLPELAELESARQSVLVCQGVLGAVIAAIGAPLTAHGLSGTRYDLRTQRDSRKDATPELDEHGPQ